MTVIREYKRLNPETTAFFIGKALSVTTKLVRLALGERKPAKAVVKKPVRIKVEKPAPKPRKLVDHSAFVQFATEHPELTQRDLAAHFDISQPHTSVLLAMYGLKVRKARQKLRREPEWTTEQFQWEQILHDQGLGMNRGNRFDCSTDTPTFFHKAGQRSATRNPDDTDV